MTPVKATALHRPEAVTLTTVGIPEDRRFYFVDELGHLVSGSRVGQLVQIHADYDPASERLILGFPDGTDAAGDTSELGPAVLTSFYGRPVHAHEVNGPWSAAVSSFVGKAVRLLRCDRDGDGSDVHHLTLVSQASMADLGARGRYDGELDRRRFRMSLELEGCEPYEEDTWEGAVVSIGEAAVRVLGQVPRCVVTQQDPDTGGRDWNTLTQIAKYRPRIAGDGGLPFGMYAEVERPGRVAIGDPADPDASATATIDLAGTAASTTPASESGAADKDF